MVKSILLKCDDEFFYKMREHKQKLDMKREEPLNWEDYIKILFGFTQ